MSLYKRNAYDDSDQSLIDFSTYFFNNICRARSRISISCVNHVRHCRNFQRERIFLDFKHDLNEADGSM